MALTNTLEVVLGAVGASTGFGGLIAGISSGRASRRRSQVDVLLALHGRFLDVFERLPEGYAVRPLEDWGRSGQNAARAYWHLARTEWLATRGSGDRELNKLWNKYFAGAIAAGTNHPGIRETLALILEADDGVNELWAGFLDDVNEARVSRGLGVL